MTASSENRPAFGELLRRSVIYADDTLPWADRVLEDYQGRATLLCRLGPGQLLPEDAGRRGLEILVIEGEIEFDGVLLGRQGYARRPDGPSPAVVPTKSTTLFVKRGHIPPEDAAAMIEPRIELWQAEPGSGLPILPLHRNAGITVVLRRYQAGAAPIASRPPGGEEILVLEGTLLDERSAYSTGTWIRNPPGTLSQPYSLEGCLVYAQSGHLPVI